MRTFLTSIILLLITLSTTATEPRYLSNSDVNARWRSMSITVKDGGQSPDVITLLKAFHAKYPTWSVEQVLKHSAKLKDGMQYEDEDDWRVLVDRRKGYADLAATSDADQVQTCVWRRSNGHRLFAVNLYEQHDPVFHVLCWFDYDPQNKLLKPERSPFDDFKTKYNLDALDCNLPHDGTNFEIYEYYVGLPKIAHIYSWDGVKHKYSKTQISDFRYQEFTEGDWQQASEGGYKEYSLVDLTGNGIPMLMLKKDDDTNYTIFSEFKGEMQTVAISDELHMINGIFHVKAEEGAPWTSDDVVVFTSDFEHVHYYSVIHKDNLSYYVIDRPRDDDDEVGSGYEPEIIGFGSADESIHIIHASVAKEITITPEWKKFEFVDEDI